MGTLLLFLFLFGIPRTHQFTVGERLTSNGLDLLATLVEAAYARDKADLFAT